MPSTPENKNKGGLALSKFIPIQIAPMRLSVAIAIALSVNATSWATEPAEQIVQNSCLGCHSAESDSAPQWSRISHQRKTPEGWLMTIGRMQQMHGLKISNQDRATLVKYLADRQGLAPSETEPYRYAMERRLDTMERFDDAQFEQMCARCHSGARVGLQRRPASEWEHLVHFHLGQWPTTEYQALSRDRDWLPIALTEMVPKLAQRFPLESNAWQQWQQADKPELKGNWSFAGYLPGRGELRGEMQVTPKSKDRFNVFVSGEYADGQAFSGSGEAIIYTGFEWRASIDIDGVSMRQVLAASASGNQLTGRMFERRNDERGMEFNASRAVAENPQILAVQPAYIKAGSETELTIVGSGLSGDVTLPQGLHVTQQVSRSENQIKLRVRADSDLAAQQQAIRVGSVSGGQLAVFDRIDRVQVVPGFTIARVGGNGGSTPKVQARFSAEAWADGADGQPNTADDYRIGYMPANWHVEPFDEAAEADNDVHFAGRMDAGSGIFTPALAGPNPARRMSTNNAGNLKVVAEVVNGQQTLQADGQLIVTVQRWNDAPLP